MLDYETHTRCRADRVIFEGIDHALGCHPYGEITMSTVRVYPEMATGFVVAAHQWPGLSHCSATRSDSGLSEFRAPRPAEHCLRAIAAWHGPIRAAAKVRRGHAAP